MNKMIDIAGQPRQIARLNREAAMALMEAGAFEDRRVEMIEGVLIEMSPANDPHGAAFSDVNFGVRSKLGAKWRVLGDTALFLADDLMLGPDILILPKGLNAQEAKGPDVGLIIEIADSTLGYDLGKKAEHYATHGVQELWVVDLSNRMLHVHRDPGLDGYGTVRKQDWTTLAQAQVIPELSLTLADYIET